MGYSIDVLKRARAKLAQQREDHISQNNARRERVYREIPRVRQIDMELRQSMVQAARAAFGGNPNAMDEVREKNQALQAERRALLEARYGAGFQDEQEFCAGCGGTGYVGATMCSCLKKLCVEEQRRELGAVFGGGESFENFRLDYYSDVTVSQLGKSHRTVMERVLENVRKYARTFSTESGNLLFNGFTGLGKTHLALAVGRAVGEMGHTVCYETALSLFNKLEQARFTPSEENRARAEKLEQCDLLIVDDLGTEMPGQFTTAALYGLLNERLMARRPMIITTNLNVDELAKRYSPQIASRIYGEFQRLTFVGSDIRVLKNRGI